MRDALFLAAAFAATCLAFASFALMQKRHWQAVTGTHDCALSGRRLLKSSGMICLAAGCAIVLWCEEADYGALLWVTQLTVAALCVVLTLSLRPQLLKPLAAVAARTSRMGVQPDEDKETNHG
jgi:Protein of unknown function (DUF3325)